MFANQSPTLANRSLLSAPGNGFEEAETGSAETRKPRTSAQPETQNLRNRRAKPLHRRAVWQGVQQTRWEQSAWWSRQDVSRNLRVSLLHINLRACGARHNLDPVTAVFNTFVAFAAYRNGLTIPCEVDPSPLVLCISA